MHIFCEVENKHFMKNRYLHCNQINIQYAFPNVAMVCTFPQWDRYIFFSSFIFIFLKGLEWLIVTTVLHMIYFLWHIRLWQVLNALNEKTPPNQAENQTTCLKHLAVGLRQLRFLKQMAQECDSGSRHKELLLSPCKAAFSVPDFVWKVLCNINKHHIVYNKVWNVRRNSTVKWTGLIGVLIFSLYKYKKTLWEHTGS